MFHVATDWNPKQAALKAAILDADRFGEAMRICAQLHSIVHSAEVYGGKEATLFDEMRAGLPREAFAAMPTATDVTIAWNIWHITRIEDIAANILICGGGQVLNGEWLRRLGITVRDTGNAMTDDEIIALSREIDIDELFNYRAAVGMRTKSVIAGLRAPDMKRKVSRASVNRVLAEGGVLEHKDSIWLLDFWGRKTVAGILQMPITRHQIGHLNDCVRLKKRIMK